MKHNERARVAPLDTFFFFKDSVCVQKKTQQIPLAHTRLVRLLAAVGLKVARSLCSV
jgi:hypothetical protein